MDQVEGTFTFVFTDIEGSTRLLRALGDDYAPALADHDAIIGRAAQAHGGRAFGSEGDAQFLVFGDVDSAIAASVDAQHALADHDWPGGALLRVRMGIHSGKASRKGDGFGGLALHATARVTAAGHGGQVLLSAASQALAGSLPQGVRFRDLGEHRLKDFDEPVRLFQLELAGLTADFPALRTTPAIAARLPTQLTEFVGRDEVSAVSRSLATARVVTLTGPGGTGKTRLAIQVASEVAGEYPDGTWFVALDAVTDPALVASEMAMALGLVGGAEAPIDRLIAWLAERTVLLVLDNLEQVIEAASDIARLLRECPRLTVLATSRIPLDIYGEHEFPVPALSVPEPGDVLDAVSLASSEAARLFVSRATAARPDFRLDDANAPVVADIVRRLDGLPLAIELAAARLRTLPLDALRQRLDDRLSTLTGGGRDRPARQQTLRGAIEWSHGLLDEPDQRLFARVGILAGTASLEQVEQVCGPASELGRDVFEGLESLSHQSLLRVLDDGTEARYGMLATIREFARERLAEGGDLSTLERRHAEAYLRLAEAAAPHLLGPDGRAWNARLEACNDDLRAALDWIVRDDEAELGLRLIVALWRFWQVRGHLIEGEARANDVLALPSVDEQPAALRARAQGAAGGISYWRSDIPATHVHYEAALKLAREAGDRTLLANALYDRGFAVGDPTATGLQRYVAGMPFFEEALALYRELGDRAGEASVLWALHQAAGALGEPERGEQLGRQALEISRQLNDSFRAGWAAFTLAVGLASQGPHRRAEARALLGESLDVFVTAEDGTGILLNVLTIAWIALEEGDSGSGWRLIGSAMHERERLGADLANEDFGLGGYVQRREPETEAERREFDIGWQMSQEETIALARRLAAEGSQPP